MATVYKIELISYWINYTEKELAEKIKRLLKEDRKKNEYSIIVKRE